MEGEQSKTVGEAASCPVVVQTSNSGMEWASAVQRTEDDLISVSRNSD